jgi:succinate dehydrogenase / fumarate reductase cytochrome b subunit
MEAKALTLHDTTIGKKALLAVTGAILFGFVIQHMLGNLQVFLGREAFNGYAQSLKSMPPLVWTVRAILLASVVVHAVVSMSLVTRSAGARHVGYRMHKQRATSYAAMTMKYGGPALALFIVFHIAHFTWPGVAFGNYVHSAPDASHYADVYGNFVGSFQNPVVVLLYVVANVFLGLHLYHGGWSLLQTLGISHPRYDHILRSVPKVIGVGVAVGNIAMPLAVLAGLIR